MITEKTYKALKTLESSTMMRPMRASEFAIRHWGEDKDKLYLFTAVSNNGNGAAAGKKAWLCAGSYLSRLAKKGYVKWWSRSLSKTTSGYFLTQQGRNAIKEYESR